METSRALMLLEASEHWKLGGKQMSGFPVSLLLELCRMILCIPAGYQVVSPTCSWGPWDSWPRRKAHKFKSRVFCPWQEVRHHPGGRDPAAVAVALGSISFHLALLAGCEFLGILTQKQVCVPTHCLQCHHLSSPHSTLLSGLPWELRDTAAEEASRQGCPLTAQGTTLPSHLVPSDPFLRIWAPSLSLLASIITSTPARLQRQDFCTQ